MLCLRYVISGKIINYACLFACHCPYVSTKQCQYWISINSKFGVPGIRVLVCNSAPTYLTVSILVTLSSRTIHIRWLLYSVLCAIQVHSELCFVVALKFPRQSVCQAMCQSLVKEFYIVDVVVN